VAVIIDATLPSQREWTGDLAALPDADVVSPGVIVIGAVAAFPARAHQLAAAHHAPGDA
jgi:siroheme synthase